MNNCFKNSYFARNGCFLFMETSDSFVVCDTDVRKGYWVIASIRVITITSLFT